MTRQKSLLSVLTLVIVALFIDPFGATLGTQDVDSYRAIRNVLDKTANSRLLNLASYDDYYSIEPNYRLRKETSESFVEMGYESVLNAASLGDATFNSYIRQQGFTHVVVPLSSSENRKIMHKWGNLGSISIRLDLPFFREAVRTSGAFPVVLYEVLAAGSGLNSYEHNSYSLEWSGVRREFYELNRKIEEVGMYDYKYNKFYTDGTDLSWVMQGTNSYTEKPQFYIRSEDVANRIYFVYITFYAAYGGNAPTQIIRVSTSSTNQSVMVAAGKPTILKLQLTSNELVSFDNVLPCRLPSTFDSSNGDQRRFCYGIGDIKVRAISQN